MRKLKYPLPVFLIIAGLAGFFIRREELKTAFDPSNGLSISGAPFHTVMAIFAAAVIVIAIAFAIGMPVKYREVRPYIELFRIHGFLWYLVILAAGVIISASGIIYGVTEVWAYRDFSLMKVAFCVLAVIMGFIVSLMGYETYKQREIRHSIFYVIPSVCLCLLLIIFYRENTANPTLTSYCYRCLAYVFCALSFYYEIAVIFKKVMPGKLIASYIAASIFEITILAEAAPLFIKLMFGALAVTHIIKCGVLVSNLPNIKHHR